jgi:hypothetical protein
MGGVKVGCFGEKSKGISVGQLDSWQLDSRRSAVSSRRSAVSGGAERRPDFVGIDGLRSAVSGHRSAETKIRVDPLYPRLSAFYQLHADDTDVTDLRRLFLEF